MLCYGEISSFMDPRFHWDDDHTIMTTTDSDIDTPGGPIGQYYLLDKIAQGGMAEIYKGLAYDLHGIKRTVVIKKILPHIAAHREFIDMLVTEAKLAVQLSHGNIAQTYDLGKVGDDYFMVMEFVDGRSVSQIMRKSAQMGEPIPLPIIAYIISEIAAGLNYMHSRNDANGRPLHIIHRDMSPQNAMVATDAAVKIIDFGIAKAVTKIEITDAGVVKGKFAYMSPEQASGDPLDSRSDIFSLGVILFEMITGRRLFKGKDNQETLRNVRRANVPLPSLYRPEVPEELNRIVLKALAQKRDNRYARASDLRDELIKFLHQHFPSFQSMEITGYLQRLFAQEDADAQSDDAKTPLLIIDRTQSAIISVSEAEALRQEIADAAPAPELPAMEVSERTPLFTEVTSIHKRRRFMVGGLLLLAVLSTALGSIYLGVWRARPTPAVVPLPIETVTTVTPVAPPPPAPPAPFADVIIDSTPTGAQIFWDDRPLKELTPFKLIQLPAPGEHQLGLHLKGYKYWSGPVTLLAGTPARVQATLERDYGTLEIISTPTAATVLINDKVAGQTPYYSDKMEPGDVIKIKVQKSGYLDWVNTMQINAGRSHILRPVLEVDHTVAMPRPVLPAPDAKTVLPAAP